MDDSPRIVCEMNEMMWGRFKDALEDLGDEEIHWRPLPEANTIDVIVRHLRIESEWHLSGLRHGAPLPTIAAAVHQETIDAVPLDFESNVKILEELYTGFIDTLRGMTMNTLQERTASAYGDAGRAEDRPQRLAYHQALHLAMHCGQIRTIRNLYRKTRGEPARFVPNNPTYPR